MYLKTHVSSHEQNQYFKFNYHDNKQLPSHAYSNINIRLQNEEHEPYGQLTETYGAVCQQSGTSCR